MGVLTTIDQLSTKTELDMLRLVRVTEAWKYDGKEVIVIGSNHLLRLNEMGASLWQKMDREHNVQQIIYSIIEEYPQVCKETVRSDVIDFLNNLVAEKLIVLEKDALSDKSIC